MGLEQFVGCWKLVSHEFRTSDGRALKPYGDDAVGWVIFDSEGRFSAQIMRPGRPDYSTVDASLEDFRAVLGGYVAYFGTYSLDEDKKTLVNKVEGSLVPGWVGGEQLRYYEISGETITLKTPPIKMAGMEVTGILSWVKA